MRLILGIESSCDETATAIVRDGTEVLSNVVISQIKVHREFGGVVPEIASRMHTEVIYQLAEKAIRDAGLLFTGNLPPVDAVAATFGPGLMGSLLVGLSFGRALAAAWKIPFVPVHHIEGHLFSAFFGKKKPEYPFLALIVSGGHTQIIACHAPHQYHVLATTRDDAVGECFDKVARLLGLPYPGGPSIQKAAKEGNPHAYAFPVGMAGKDTLDFSFSGLKTAVLYKMRQEPDADLADVAASFQATAVESLMVKLRLAIEQTGIHRLVIAGGVAANELLREKAALLDAELFLPPFTYCLDNAAMIAAAAYSRLRTGKALPTDTAAVSTLALQDLPG
ncbi:MAG TPA: tRNA (adenosine(37)-N6)-threonylcarbamoyltransferase complex transferase subunit TsaD [Candidatus Hydrogenedentes bacterium]|nr:MAG: tRNA N6-adenosine threonylcarbamoyltransferase [Candidatus Hydrogenedentes bacterium ADurb.Bin170]HNZ47449.1 tRNA (adenosine(37)-N6)-threonylcarbamoyltransferase complex transferase subunit TsaD [Candidatus Hydrogenedentota bacterium]HOD94685.1 tRNA (adenosine(37)-N6)-threonylcarbamoyltransferase complex transferase subunit TsaD [Candidatus Hydrogenedentota bacterium]HOH42232.1 tRNA (adenosine(37)-N6)-threonylcarbamoyltransferase complex transferase subunit TsaD [Candidatus Hydrogenedent